MPSVRSFLPTVILAITLLWPSAASAENAEIASEGSNSAIMAPIIDSLEPAYASLASHLNAYVLDATFSPVTERNLATISGTEQLTYHNNTGAPIDTIYFRLYANNDEYGTGAISVDTVTVDRKPILNRLSVSDTLLTISLNTPLAVGRDVVLNAAFTTTIPTDPQQSYGMFKYDKSSKIYSLAHWLPLLAGWDTEAGWNTDPISVNGDPVFTAAATFDVRLTAPADLIFATSGSLIDAPDIDGDQQRMHFTSGPSRDFDMAASSEFVVSTAMAGGTEIRSFALPRADDGAAVALKAGTQAVKTYSDLVGEYPYEELDIVQVEVGNGAGGVEFPGLVFIGADFYDLNGEADQSVPHLLEFIVVHEVAHQWFYNVIGSDQYLHAFLDEAMANAMSVNWFAENYDSATANQQANYQLRAGYFNLLFHDGDQVVDQPTDAFASMDEYGVIIYGKGALAFLELQKTIGNDAFFAALHQYFQDYAFAIATPDDLRAEFEQSSGSSLTDFWQHWFEEADGLDDFDASDLSRMLRELNGT
jgi:hypothetical protein